ncbi:hypothetical protein [Arthrobacter sp. ERGS1:01]|uniref:hypothetical protein n=1 Tax=Arthrobacter sp. ERGS1:01 TaxID=1704044 RepID=UPI000AD8EFEE|nr:hypothetical protein [Arthrobacter sp. ERGS1:01]
MPSTLTASRPVVTPIRTDPGPRPIVQTPVKVTDHFATCEDECPYCWGPETD